MFYTISAAKDASKQSFEWNRQDAIDIISLNEDRVNAHVQ
tara:strand:+ start:636 stop:755 length:120 start_codon:yes stop_codon:yes gene_type:complete